MQRPVVLIARLLSLLHGSGLDAVENPDKTGSGEASQEDIVAYSGVS